MGVVGVLSYRCVACAEEFRWASGEAKEGEPAQATPVVYLARVAPVRFGPQLPPRRRTHHRDIVKLHLHAVRMGASRAVRAVGSNEEIRLRLLRRRQEAEKGRRSGKGHRGDGGGADGDKGEA